MKSFLLLVAGFVLAHHVTASSRSMNGISISNTPPPQRMKGIQFQARADRGTHPPETIGGFKLFQDDEQLFDGRTIGVWCDQTGSGVLLKDTFQECIALLEDWEWEEAHEADRVELIFENYSHIDNVDSNIVIKDGEFWFFNKNILKSAYGSRPNPGVDSNTGGRLSRVLRGGHFKWTNVDMFLPPIFEDDATPIDFKVQAKSGTTDLSVKGVLANGSGDVDLEYECSTETFNSQTTISDDDWYVCSADAGGHILSGIVFKAATAEVEVKMGHFFYDRVNIWQTATIQGSGDPQSDSLGAGHVPANTPIHLTINPEDCRAVCCYVQEDYHPYPSCKLYCDNAICLESLRGDAYKSEDSCCKAKGCKKRPEECWAASSSWPVKTCTADPTKCNEGDKSITPVYNFDLHNTAGNVFGSEEECCADDGSGAFPGGCDHIGGGFGPCWKQRSDAPYPHCEKLKNAECEATDGVALENIARGKRVSTNTRSSHSWRRLAVDGTTRSCSYQGSSTSPWLRIDLRDRSRDIRAVRLSSYYYYRDLEIRLGNNYYPSGNPICANSGQPLSTDRSLTEYPCVGSGRFLHIALPSTRRRRYLRICEVEVMARHKYNDEIVRVGSDAATQSSTWGSRYPASNAVDGDTQSTYRGGCARTNYEYQPYWGVDLGTNRWVTRIKLARPHYYYLYGMELRVGQNQDFSQNPVQVYYSRLYSEYLEIQLPELIVGRYVSLHLRNRSGRLYICEVEVYAGPIAWGPSNYFPTERTCCNSSAFDGRPCAVKPPTPCWAVATWFPQECNRYNDETKCTRGWGVYDSREACCSAGFYNGQCTSDRTTNTLG